MRNEIIFDAKGRPDIMVTFSPEELGLPDILKGRKVKEYAISKYPNTLIDGVPYSLPFQEPAVNVDFDEAIKLCESKGPMGDWGCGCFSAPEISLLCSQPVACLLQI